MTPYAFTETVLLTTIGMFPLGTNIEPASKKLLFPLASQESEALPFGIARILPLFSSLLQSQSLAPVPLLIVFA